MKKKGWTRPLKAFLCTALAAAGATSSPRAGGAVECQHVLATISVAWDAGRTPTADGVVARLTYPREVDVPTAAGSPSAAARVERRGASSGGLFDAVRTAAENAGGERRLNVGLVTHGIEPGELARVRFDCAPGAVPPAESAFSCTAEVSDAGDLVPATCRVHLSSP